MPTDMIARFVLGGVIVSAFSVLGDLLRPKSFAGVFGAAPSVALATLGLTYATHGAEYVSTEARSMVLGGVALAVYGFVVSRLLLGRSTRVLISASASLGLWMLFDAGVAGGRLWGLGPGRACPSRPSRRGERTPCLPRTSTRS